MFSKILNNIPSFVAFNRTTTKLALVVRGDIRMSKGKTAAQCAHATVLCYQESETCPIKKNLINQWCYDGQPKIVLKIPTYTEMQLLQEKAKEAGVISALVQDAGHTQLKPGTATVLGIGPASSEQINKLVQHLKLL